MERGNNLPVLPVIPAYPQTRGGEIVNTGETLKAARTAAKLTQVQLAARVGVDPCTISRLERGVSSLRKGRNGVDYKQVRANVEKFLGTQIWKEA